MNGSDEKPAASTGSGPGPSIDSAGVKPHRPDDVELGPTLTASSRTHTPSKSDSEDGDSTSSLHDDDDVDEDNDEALSRLSTHNSLGPDMAAPIEPQSSVVEVPDDFYDRLPPSRKAVIVAVCAYVAFLSPMTSTTVLSAVPEVAAEYRTTGAVINVSNALYMLCMGLSPVFWGPLAQVYGRRAAMLSATVAFFLSNLASALAPNLAAFFIFRMCTAYQGTALILVGAAVIGDIYRPTERGTALGWYLSGGLTGPAFGPVIGGIIVTYTSWRVIFWLQTGLSGAAAAAVFFLLPETIFHRKADDLAGLPLLRKLRVLRSMMNPWRVVRLFRYPNLNLVGVASSSLLWNMFSVLTPIRYVLNPRFGLSTPLQGGLFYLAPGCGYLVGTLGGGRYADYMAKKWIRRRGGTRVPEDRLRSALPFMGGVIPATLLVYGWAVEKDAGGIPLVVVALFAQGVAQLHAFPSLNTYCLDVVPGRGAEVISGNYLIRYMFAAAGSAAVLPAVEAVGVGWFSTISAAFVFGSAGAVWATVLWGKGWRDRVDGKRRAAKEARRARRRREGCGDKDAAGTGPEGGGERVRVGGAACERDVGEEEEVGVVVLEGGHDHSKKSEKAIAKDRDVEKAIADKDGR